jgi:hypothetical protein
VLLAGRHQAVHHGEVRPNWSQRVGAHEPTAHARRTVVHGIHGTQSAPTAQSMTVMLASLTIVKQQVQGGGRQPHEDQCCSDIPSTHGCHHLAAAAGTPMPGMVLSPHTNSPGTGVLGPGQAPAAGEAGLAEMPGP